jgi:hypothetical protein
MTPAIRRYNLVDGAARAACVVIMRLLSTVRTWPCGPATLIAIALVVLALPDRVEGPVLVQISEGHALSVLDTVAVVPLIIASLWLKTGLWQRRGALQRALAGAPERAGIALFVSGVGLGLLIASAFSSFFWWWAIGAAVFGITVIIAVLVAVRAR